METSHSIDWHEQTFNPTLTQITDSIPTTFFSRLNPIWLIVDFQFCTFSHFVIFSSSSSGSSRKTDNTQGNVNFSHVEHTASSNNNNTKMFSSLFEAARSSPFKGPLTVARCEAAAGGAPPAGGDSCEFGSTKYFLLCGLGGIISCGKCVCVCMRASEWHTNIHSRAHTLGGHWQTHTHTRSHSQVALIIILLCCFFSRVVFVMWSSSAKYHCYVIFIGPSSHFRMPILLLRFID